MPQILVVLAMTALEPLPPCRLDSGMAKIVGQTIDDVLSVSEPEFRARFRVSKVNPSTLEPDALTIQLIGDLPEGMADATGCPLVSSPAGARRTRDRMSVKGFCEVASSAPAVIRCASGAVAAIASKNQWEGSRSAPLAYVLAHELSHVRHGDNDAFVPAERVIHLEQKREQKLDALRTGCTPNPFYLEVRMREDRADREAMDLLLRLGGAPPYLEVGAPIASVAVQFDRAAGRIRNWMAEWGETAPWPRALLDPDFPATSSVVDWAAQSLICEISEGKKGRLAVPTGRSTHPPAYLRLERAHAELRAHAQVSPGLGGYGQPEKREALEALSVFQAREMLRLHEFIEAVATATCRTLARQDLPRCKRVPREPPDQGRRH